MSPISGCVVLQGLSIDPSRTHPDCNVMHFVTGHCSENSDGPIYSLHVVTGSRLRCAGSRFVVVLHMQPTTTTFSRDIILFQLL